MIGAEHHAEGREDDVERGLREAELLDIRHLEANVEGIGPGARLPPLQKRGHVIRRGNLRKPAGGGEGGVAVSRRDIEDPLAGAQIDRLAQGLADDLKRCSDD